MRCHCFSLPSVLTAVALLADLVTPLSTPWDDIHVKHTWNSVPANWESLGPPPAGTTINLHIALHPQNENALVDALYQVSSPRHPRYGAHLSKEEAAKLVAPHSDTLELVNSWLKHHSVPSSSISMTHGGSWLTVTRVPVSRANRLLSASPGTNETAILRTVSYGLPTVLHTHVQTVAPTTYFASARTLPQTSCRRSVEAAPALDRVASRELVTRVAGDNEYITPSDLRWLYWTFAYTPAATDRNKLAVAGFLDQYPNQADLTAFMNEYLAEAKTATYTVEQINYGGYDQSNPGIEANINVQYTQGMAYPTPLIYYSTGLEMDWTPPENEPAPGDMYLEWFEYVLDKTDIPQTISTSYGAKERVLPVEYAKAVCRMYALLGARGVSVLYASGDHGVGEGDCKVDDGSGRVQFIPMFPASCPWVTSVGGTNLFPEAAAELSGGGFSFYFPRPDYQDDVVPAYLEHLGSQYDGLYDPTGRGIPDISAQALNYIFVLGGARLAADGTSCATSTVAGIISLLNDYLISNGKSPLGFLNPWLYSDGLSGFNDITSGSNPGCKTEGFSAATGWDPVRPYETSDCSFSTFG
ncbi:subtilisin-like protein [Lactarius psammicola]|nr:subtilisin-like protein [Lactarius psammicola]